MMEHDPNISVQLKRVELSPEDAEELQFPEAHELLGIEVRLGRSERLLTAQRLLTARSAVDLHHKLGLALNDWVSQAAELILR